MASSSRAKKQHSSMAHKKQHTSMAHKKQGTSSLEANPLDLARLLANDEQSKVFTKHFLGSPIFSPKFFKEEIEMRKKIALGETVRNRDILAVGNLNLEDRLLHYFLSFDIIPKYSNHSQINDMELKLMYALKHNLDINWALTNFGVSMAGESKITLNARHRKIDVDVIHKMVFFRDLTHRVHKHRNDKLAAPVDPTTKVSVNPPAQQPFNFHTESSSSSQMPSNQMIMDELFSL
ncbi:hypothetical protein Lal_00039854 [Lupinus albus]|nr:hypothetical protein Lal_00039854 [Lupinus albus]